MSLRVLIIVENLPVPLDRRVWQEACALRDAGHDVTVICPQMRGYTTPFEVLDGITIYRHWITDEAKGIEKASSASMRARCGRRLESVEDERLRRGASVQSAGPALPRGAAVQAARGCEGDLRRA